MPLATPAPDDSPIFLSVMEAAAILGRPFKPMEVYELCEAGVIEHQYHGRILLIRPAALQAYADSLPTKATA